MNDTPELYVYIDGEWVDAYAPIESMYLDLFTPAYTTKKGSRCVCIKS